jgi:4-diphosphocytidyl-2-C-methyl-D-erythritol kinase
MHARPRAKVNLTLEIGERDADGYHALESVFLRIGLADELTVAFSEGRARDELTLGGLPGAPVDGNLVLRAFANIRAVLGRDLPALAAHLDKRIPIAAGLGGGSADAAAAIDAALQMWRASLEPDEIALASAALGSDVPFFTLNAPAALVAGRGERLTALPALAGEAAVLLFCPHLTISTADAYSRFDELGGAPARADGVTRDLAGALLAGLDGHALATTWAGRLRDANDLWPAAADLQPALEPLRDELEHFTGMAWLMTGSGPTLFSLHSNVEDAIITGQQLARAGASVLAQGRLLFATNLVGPDPAWRYE